MARTITFSCYFTWNDEGTDPYVYQCSFEYDKSTSDQQAVEHFQGMAQDCMFRCWERLQSEKGEHGREYEFNGWSVRNQDGLELKSSTFLAVNIPSVRAKSAVPSGGDRA